MVLVLLSSKHIRLCLLYSQFKNQLEIVNVLSLRVIAFLPSIDVSSMFVAVDLFNIIQMRIANDASSITVLSAQT